jgi:hypothetical protein
MLFNVPHFILKCSSLCSLVFLVTLLEDPHHAWCFSSYFIMFIFVNQEGALIVPMLVMLFLSFTCPPPLLLYRVRLHQIA